MSLHSLKSSGGATRPKKRVGRGQGSGTGKTCGKGQKGQMSRAGHKRKLGFEGGQMPLIRRLPKRGFTNRNRKVFFPINVATLAQFDADSEVTVESLRKAGLANGGYDGIKILGGGDLDRKLTVKVHAFSSTAQAKIEAAGGTCEVIP